MGRKEQLQDITQLLSQPEILDLAKRVSAGTEALDELLQELYRQGFSDAPVWENADHLFSQRVCQVQMEFSQELEAYRRDNQAWLREQLDGAEAPEQFVCALGVLAAELYGSEYEKAELRRMEDGRKGMPYSGELMRTLAEIGMSGLFCKGYGSAGLPENLLGNVSAVLAMTSYIAIKREYLPEIHPELSLDAVSVLSRGLAGVLCEENGATAEERSFVSAVLAAKRMNVRKWSVLDGCMRTLPQLCGKVIGELLQPVLRTAAPGAAVRWKRLPVQKKSIRPLIELMTTQQDTQIEPDQKDMRKERTREDKSKTEL